MNVYYIFGLTRLADFHKSYTQTRGIILKEGHILTRDWLNAAIQNINNKVKQPKRSTQFTKINQAIRDADVCIFDITVKSMAVGMQVAYAIERGKPTLLLSDKNHADDVTELFVYGSKSGYLTIKEYEDEASMFRHVTKFFAKNDPNHKKERINLAIEKDLFDYVSFASYHYGSSKTSVIRDAIRKTMDADEEYLG